MFLFFLQSTSYRPVFVTSNINEIYSSFVLGTKIEITKQKKDES